MQSECTCAFNFSRENSSYAGQVINILQLYSFVVLRWIIYEQNMNGKNHNNNHHMYKSLSHVGCESVSVNIIGNIAQRTWEINMHTLAKLKKKTQQWWFTPSLIEALSSLCLLVAYEFSTNIDRFLARRGLFIRSWNFSFYWTAISWNSDIKPTIFNTIHYQVKVFICKI